MTQSQLSSADRSHKAAKQPRRFGKWVRRLCVLLVCAFVLANLAAYMQARAMTHFASVKPRTLPPQKMTRWQKLKVILTGVQIPRPINLMNPSARGLSFETDTFTSRDGLRLEGWHIPAVHPRGIVLVFPGYAASKSIMLDYAPPLHEMGYDIFMVDFRGCGGSGGDTTTLGLREADDVAASVDYARAHWPNQRLILYGQSMGSVAILRAISVDHVAPDSIVIECPYDRILSTVTIRFHIVGLPAHPLAELLVFWGGAPSGYWAFQLDAVKYAHDVACPAMLLRGQSDPFVTDAAAHSVFDALSGSKKFVTIAGAAHESYAKVNLRDWRQAVGNFLAAGN